MHHHDEHFAGHPHDHRQHRMWLKFQAMGRRGWGFGGFGPGGPGGAGDPRRGGWGGWGDEFRIGRMLASGDLRLIALYFIDQQPRHGYDLIKAIEEKTGGVYVPSPGVVYPALTFLEEAGYATSTAEANKRLYTITEEGRSHLSDNRTAVEGTLEHLSKIGERMRQFRAHWQEAGDDRDQRPDRDINDVPPEVNEARRDLKHAIRQAAKNGGEETKRRLAEILKRAAEEIRGLGGKPGADDIDI